MADYNVNMKQWNGTSFDNVLPLAYNAKQLGGQSLAEVKQWVQDNGLLLYTGQYTGTGTYGKNKPTRLTFPFEPVLFFFPSGFVTFFANELSTTVVNCFVGDVNYVNIKKSADGKTISWYSDSSAREQYNDKGKTYYYAAIGGNDIGEATEWLWTSNASFTVPKTGRYTLELYGGGGGSVNNSLYTGGSSCQTYDEINLTKGESFAVTVGTAGVGWTGRQGGASSFGSYTVAGATNATISSGGNGAGNKGANGSGTGYGGHNYPSGSFGTKYGYGTSPVKADEGAQGGPGAVYLKYLGA